jgi:lipopolysaccharide export LptBFGC system permease protein LptF
LGYTNPPRGPPRARLAAVAGGVSLFRLARPVIAIALLMLALQVTNQELVIPRIAHLLARDNNQAGVRTLSTFNVRLTPDDQNRVIMARSFDPSTKVLTGLYVLERDTTGAAKRKIVADSATWTGSLWQLTNGFVRPAGIAARSENDPRIARAEPVKALKTNIDPTTLLANHYRSFSTSLSWRQISDVLATPGLTPQVREQMARIGWGRVSMLLSTILSLIIAMPFFLRKEPGNMAVQSLKCAPVAIGCLLGGVLGASLPLPASLLAPSVAVFLPIVVLLPLAIAMISGVRS